MKCLIQLFSATVFQEYSLKNSCRWTTPYFYHVFLSWCWRTHWLFEDTFEGHACRLEMLKILSRVPCNAICHLVGKVQHEEKKENGENVANKNEKKVISPQKCKEMRPKILPSNEKKKILTVTKRQSLSQKEKKEIWQQNKKDGSQKWVKRDSSQQW